jgi:hypothetical protein
MNGLRPVVQRSFAAKMMRNSTERLAVVTFLGRSVRFGG